jgi:hypothetical protein
MAIFAGAAERPDQVTVKVSEPLMYFCCRIHRRKEEEEEEEEEI